jgi:hypothetical protein
MRKLRFWIAGAFLLVPAAAQATTVIIYINPMTLEHYTRVIATPGPDRAMMCMAPPAISNCTELPVRHTR